MIDLHCHLLPNIGDGPSDPDDSLKMLKSYASWGITHITAVCHFETGVEERMREELALLRPAAERLGVTLGMAVEYDFADLDMVDDFTTVDGSGKYFLLDFATMELPISAENILHKLRSRGLIAIIVHPERLFGRRTLHELMKMRYLGFFMMPNAASFLPESHCRETAWGLLRSGQVNAIASDAHTDAGGFRPSRLRECRDLIAKRCGAGYAKMLFETNPARLLNGETAIPVEQWLRPSFGEKISRMFSKF